MNLIDRPSPKIYRPTRRKNLNQRSRRVNPNRYKIRYVHHQSISGTAYAPSTTHTHLLWKFFSTKINHLLWLERLGIRNSKGAKEGKGSQSAFNTTTGGKSGAPLFGQLDRPLAVERVFFFFSSTSVEGHGADYCTLYLDSGHPVPPRFTISFWDSDPAFFIRSQRSLPFLQP